MKRPIIYLAFTDDWELRGDGSGDITQLQFDPMDRLIDVFGRYSVRSTFMVEVMQQLTMRREQLKFPELKPLADKWDEKVRNAYRSGHDIQLHVHPQWSEAFYQDGRWRLTGDWSLLNYPPNDAETMISEAKRYIVDLLTPIDPSYKCVAFRSGSSVIAPSPFVLELLARQGITFDLSIVGGLMVNTRNVKFDYAECDEAFLPYFPRMDDARRMSDRPERIICVPIFHFYGSRRQSLKQIYSKVKVALQKNTSNNTSHSSEDWHEVGRGSFAARLTDKILLPVLQGKHLTADIGQLNYALLTEMLDKIRLRAKRSGLDEVPVILTNHSKYMADTSDIEAFLRNISSADDVRTITLTEMASRLQAGQFEIKKRPSLNTDASGRP